MNSKLVYLLFVFALLSCKEQALTQENNALSTWNKEAANNIRLLPKYGNTIKSSEQLAADNEFITSVLSKDTNRLKASNEYINLGFKYLYQNDIKTAMYRFNQAYLIDSTNVFIYWGYGGVYMQLDDMPRAKLMYETGLKLAPNNPELLTDFATYYLKLAEQSSDNDFNKHIKNAMNLLLSAYEAAPKSENITYKLSICYYYLQNCEEAKKYLQLCKDAGGQPIEKEFELELERVCS